MRPVRAFGLGILVVLLILGGLYLYNSGYLGFINPNKVQITGINLQTRYSGLLGNVTQYLGPSSQALSGAYTLNGNSDFVYTITLLNQDPLLGHSIDSIVVETPDFSLKSVSPSLPYQLPRSSSASFTVTISVPSNYNGIVAISVKTH